MVREINQGPKAVLNISKKTASYHPLLCYGRVRKTNNDLKYSDSWQNLLESNNGKQFIEDCHRCAVVSIDLEGFDDQRMMGLINAGLLNCKYEKKSSFAQFRMTTMTGITVVVAVEFTGRLSRGAMLPAQICEILNSNQIFKIGCGILGDVYKLAAANVVVNNTVDVGHVLRYLVPKFQVQGHTSGLPNLPGKKHCLRALKLEDRIPDVEEMQAVITQWDFTSYVDPGTVNHTIEEKMREGAYNIIDDYLPFLVLFRVVQSLSVGKGWTLETNMMEPILALCARCKDWTCEHPENFLTREAQTAKGPTTVAENPYSVGMPNQAGDKEMVNIMSDVGLIFPFEDAFVPHTVLKLGPNGLRTTVRDLKAQVFEIRGRRPGNLADDFREFAHRVFAPPRSYVDAIHPCPDCHMVHDTGISIKLRQCFTQKPCIYILCPNKAGHAVSACPHLVRVCGRCGLVGHGEDDHKIANILELRNIIRLYYTVNPSLLPLMNKDLCLTVGKQRAGAELIVARPYLKYKSKPDIVYRDAVDAFRFDVTPCLDKEAEEVEVMDTDRPVGPDPAEDQDQVEEIEEDPDAPREY
jgi:hypothetical protein